jgi:hypothetical protein
METKGQPAHSPAPSTDASAVSESTIAEGPPQSPETQLPAYGDEREPPKYQENGLSKGMEAVEKAKMKRTLFIRLLTSIFITILVSLVVAAAVGRIHDWQVTEKRLREEQR